MKYKKIGDILVLDNNYSDDMESPELAKLSDVADFYDFAQSDTDESVSVRS